MTSTACQNQLCMWNNTLSFGFLHSVYITWCLKLSHIAHSCSNDLPLSICTVKSVIQCYGTSDRKYVLFVCARLIKLYCKLSNQINLIQPHLLLGLMCSFQSICVNLGTLTKLRNVAISFVVSVLLFICMEHPGSHCTDFHEIWYFIVVFWKSLQIQVSLKSDKNNAYFTSRSLYVYDHILLLETAEKFI